MKRGFLTVREGGTSQTAYSIVQVGEKTGKGKSDKLKLV
jgi:hypothetical protein